MSTNENMKDQDRWLAAEYALGVLSGSKRKQAEKRVDADSAFREDVEAWQAQLSPLLEEVDEVQPRAAVWNSLDARLFEPAKAKSAPRVDADASGFWKLLAAFSSTVAVASFAVMMFVTGGDFTGKELETTRLELASAQSKVEEAADKLKSSQEELDEAAIRLADLEREADQSRDVIETARQELQTTQEALEAANNEIAAVRQEVLAAKPLVASLTQSGDAPAFVATYDPLKKALLIRTAVEDTDEKVPEVWLIPAQGDRKGEVLSLGVMDEAAPDTLPISDDFVSLIGEGGTLAITMEPIGGAPNGVATGPVIALGQLQAF